MYGARQPTVKHSIQWRSGAPGDAGVPGMYELRDSTSGGAAHRREGFVGEPSPRDRRAKKAVRRTSAPTTTLTTQW